MEHATGWRSRDPLYRNYFAATPDSEDWRTWAALTARGLANCFTPSNEEARMFPLTYFHVTPLGIKALGKRRRSGRGKR